MLGCWAKKSSSPPRQDEDDDDNDNDYDIAGRLPFISRTEAREREERRREGIEKKKKRRRRRWAAGVAFQAQVVGSLSLARRDQPARSTRAGT